MRYSTGLKSFSSLSVGTIKNGARSELAYKQRLVMASTKGDDGQMYVYTRDGVAIPFEQLLAEYPLEKLKMLL